MSQMLKEVAEAPDRIREFLGLDDGLYATVGARLRELKPAFLATVARGSSGHVADYARHLVPLCTGTLVAPVPPSLTTVLDAPLRAPAALTISQGGGSPDLIRTCERLRAAGSLVLGLLNNVASPLAATADVVLDQHAGPERSLAATKSVLCSLAAVARLTAVWSQDADLLAGLRALPRSLEGLRPAPADLLAGFDHVVVIGRALGQCVASELALKLKETCGLHAEAFSSAEVLHGPREMVDSRFLVIALALPGPGQEQILEAARALEGQGARVVLLGPAALDPTFLLPGGVDARLAPLVALQVLYPWLGASALALGRDPDTARHLPGKIIKTV